MKARGTCEGRRRKSGKRIKQFGLKRLRTALTSHLSAGGAIFTSRSHRM
jgi:hypothetical protein